MKIANSYPLMLLLLAVISYAGIAYAASLQGNPTTNNRQTSPYGWRTSTNSNHMAVDYGAATRGVGGQSIYSTHGGKVVESRYQSNGRGGWGNTVVVESASGNYRTRYSHLQNPGLSNGSTVSPGQQVGQMGGTGKPGGYDVHLDYAVMVKDPNTGKFHAIDPNEAAGKDLDDPAVREQLIEDAKEKVEGKLKEEGAPQGGQNDTSPSSGSGSDSAVIGCDSAILKSGEIKVQALRQQETEAAKALITKPVSVQQLTCFDQYAKTNAEEIGRIHSDPPEGISDTIAPIVEQPNMQYIIQNFMTGVLGGGFQSMLNGVMGQLTGALGGLGGGGGSGCQAMDEMWKLLQCMDFPQMPNLSDIMGGGGGGLGGALSSLGGAGGLGSLGGGGGGGGIMGAVCQAMKGAMGGGGSGGTESYENLLEENLRETEDNSDIYSEENLEKLRKAIEETASGDNLCVRSTWEYRAVDVSRMDVLVKNGELDTSEFVLFDTDGSCSISEDEIKAYEALSGSNGEDS